MELFRHFRGKFHDDWCSRCTKQMEIERKQLYAMPGQLVGHYVSHSDAEYYKSHLTPVRCKADIPTGMYACGLILYRCPYCGHSAVKLSTFLPVRGVEKVEEAFYFEDCSLDSFLKETALETPEPPQAEATGTLSSRRVIRPNR